MIAGDQAEGLAPAPAQGERSYRTILKSSALVGSSAAITVCIGMVRTKAMAMLLGPAGYGVMGAFVQVTDLARTVAQLGINSSGVRQIAQAAASDEPERIARTVAAVHWSSLACGVVGAALLALFSAPISALTFGDAGHAGEIAWLSLVVLFAVVAGGQGALLQGMRHIADLSKLAVLAGLAGTLVGVALVAVLGESGLVPMLIAGAAISALGSWWYCKRRLVMRLRAHAREVVAESAELAKLGLAFLASGLLMSAASYAVRTILLRDAGFEAAGMYYAAWTLGSLYIGFVLQALATDFYPRLVGAIDDPEHCNRLVNEQTTVSLLLALPGVLFTLTFAPLALSVFYSERFAAGVDVLRWICLGMSLRVLTWPIGFIVVAKGRRMTFFAIEAAWSVVNVSLTWWALGPFGVKGAGIAFFATYVLHGLLVYPIVHRLTGFRWSPLNLRCAAGGFGVVGLVFVGFHVMPPAVATSLGALACAGCCYASLQVLVRLVGPQALPRPLARILRSGGPMR